MIGLATVTWFYATTFWSQPLATAWLVGAIVMLVLSGRENRAARCMAFAAPLLVTAATLMLCGRAD